MSIFLLSIFCIATRTVLSQPISSSKCGLPKESLTAKYLLDNPPKESEWSIDCITEKLIEEFFDDEIYVNKMVECVRDIPSCEPIGHRLVAGKILLVFVCVFFFNILVIIKLNILFSKSIIT